VTYCHVPSLVFNNTDCITFHYVYTCQINFYFAFVSKACLCVWLLAYLENHKTELNQISVEKLRLEMARSVQYSAEAQLAKEQLKAETDARTAIQVDS